MENCDVLKILYDKRDDFVSGQEIANKFNISRAAISKRIEKLKECGIIVNAVSNKGYKLVSIPDEIIEETATLGIKEDMIIGQKIYVFDSIDSTNEYLKKIAKDSKEGTVILAKEQTKGKGRRGREFSSLKGGIYFSILLKPDINIEKVPFLTQLSACSVYKALESMNIKTQIKWPNDIILNNKKLVGILCEMSCEIDYLSYVIAGIGINIDDVAFDEEIEKIATSTQKEGYNIKKIDLFWRVLEYFDYFYKKFNQDDYSEMIDILKKNSYILNKDVNIIYADKVKTGKAIDIDNNGFLVVKYDDNTTESLNYGEISIRTK